MEINRAKISIVKGDITEEKVDAIVNAANNKLIMGGGVAGAIRKKGGPSIQKQASKLTPMEIGQAALTTAGDLNAKYVIHAATMGMDFKTDQNIIRQATREALSKTKDKDIKSIAFPALGCGVGKFPPDEAAKIMIEEVVIFLHRNDNLKKVLFVLYDDRTYRIFKNTLEERFYRVKKKIEEYPIPTVDIIIKKGEKVILIKRKNPPFGWAIPGGFVELGESVEVAAAREAEEETGIKVKNLRQFHVYSKPDRDPRFYTISCVFTAETNQLPKAASDAEEVELFGKDELPSSLVFDHKKILSDYFKSGRQE